MKKITLYKCVKSHNNKIFRKNGYYLIDFVHGKASITDERGNVRLTPDDHNYLMFKFEKVERYWFNNDFGNNS